MTTPELSPCPKCGSTSIKHFAYDKGYSVFCRLCKFEISSWHESKEQAAEAWNALPRHLQWTTKPPTKPGWYWYRLANGESSGDIVRLYDAWLDGRLCVYNGLEKPIVLRDFHGGNVEWAGPIPYPQEPK